LVKKGIKLKYRRSYLGIIWTLLEPVLTTAVLVVVFQYLMPKKDVEMHGVIARFPVYILSARLIYTCFSSATKGALTSIRKNAALIKKVYVPKYFYPLSAIIFNFIIFAISLIVLVLGMVIYKVKPTWHMFEAIIPLFILFMMCLGFGMILSTVAVFFRDMEYLWGVALMMLMYGCAIFYDVSVIYDKVAAGTAPKIIKYFFECNPLYGVILSFRECVLYQHSITYNGLPFIASLVAGVVSIVIGLIAFYKKQDEFILHI
jgi:ABC-2 type transport system permease protein